MILWDWLPSFSPVSLAFFTFIPLSYLPFPFRKIIAHCIEKLTFHAAEFVSIWEDIQKHTFFFSSCCAFTVLYKIFHLQLIPADHLLPLLCYSIKYVDIKALKSFLLSKTSIFCIWEQEATAFLQAPLVGTVSTVGMAFSPASHSECYIVTCWSVSIHFNLPIAWSSSFVGRWTSCTCRFPVRVLRHKRTAFLWVTLRV